MRGLLVRTVFFGCTVLAAGGVEKVELPALERPDYVVVDGCNYRSDEEAREKWVEMTGIEPVSVVRAGGRNILMMPCRFRGNKAERTSWDRAVDLDLSMCRGLVFSFYCDDPTAISRFSFYFHSGNGWYAGRFEQSEQSCWNRIVVEKEDTDVEGAPGGWGKIDRIRISAWRGGDVDTVFYIADIGLLGRDAPILIIRGDSVTKSKPEEVGSVTAYTRSVAEHLTNLGLSYCVMSDLDVTLERLRDKKLVILSHNPGMPEAVALKIGKFLEYGGKMICFYILPPELESMVKMRRGRHLRQTYPGQFAFIHASGNVLRGLPPVVEQSSWNIYQAEPIEGQSRTAAYWHDDKGGNTGDPAIIVSDNCILMTHVLISDDPINKHNMLLAMVGHFVPELWRESARQSIERVGKFGPYQDADQARQSIRQIAGQDENVAGMLKRADELQRRAKDMFAQGKFPEAITDVSSAREMMIRAYCSIQTPQENEQRAFWCHSPFGVLGMEWDEAVKILADNGFTAILPNMLWGGTAYYKSEVLPVAPEIKEKGDQITKCLAACRKHGVECHIWKVNWNMSGRTQKEFAGQMKKEGRTQVSFDGSSMDEWLCPSHPANQKLEIESMVEVVRKYDIDGIHFDYIRYPGEHCCFCKGCRQRFEGIIGTRIKNWPSDVRQDEELRKKWLDFRRSNITTVVAAVCEAARKIRPEIKISAAIFSNWPDCRDSIGQDWKLWCEKGYLDFVCPMDYTANNLKFENMVRRQLSLAGEVPCYPGIGLSTWSSLDRVCRLIEQIKITRELRTGGFIVFEYGVPEASGVVPLCGMGITRKKSAKPLRKGVSCLTHPCPVGEKRANSDSGKGY